jgi:cyclophilin family peptidyl-prolyl cis-trans isomerase
MLGLLLALLATSACGSKSTTSTTPTNAGTTTTATRPGFPTKLGSAQGCTAATLHTHPGRKFVNEHLQLDVKKVELLMHTNCGEFVITIDKTTSPNAAASFVSLARRGFYDDTYIHRVVPGWIFQGGDPTGTGSGGPAYSTHDKVPKTVSYTYGTVAMAKSPQQPDGTAGSQFFVVTAKNANLPPQYAVVGKVTRGFAVINRIGALGNAQQQPTANIVVASTLVGIKK